MGSTRAHLLQCVDARQRPAVRSQRHPFMAAVVMLLVLLGQVGQEALHAIDLHHLMQLLEREVGLWRCELRGGDTHASEEEDAC